MANNDDACTTCTDCGNSLRRCRWTFWKKAEYGCEGMICSNQEDGQVTSCPSCLCKACHNKHPLLVVKEGDPKDLSHATMKKFCKGCFQNESTIDFSCPYTKIPGDSGITFVFVHGGGASRELFHGHALELKERYGHASVLLDLPGHGALVDTPLTPESCCETVRNVLTECGLTKQDSQQKIIYAGGSLGAYTGFYVLDKLKDAFDGAVLIDCGQNVGPGASFKAKMGLVMLSWLGKNFSNAGIMDMMIGVSKKSKADYKMVETCYGAGMFFGQADAQVKCLKAIAPAERIPNLNIPILFMNGGEDYRDSENKWLDLCVNGGSELKVYDGGDHFFTHDTRFLEDMLERMDAFAKKI